MNDSTSSYLEEGVSSPEEGGCNSTIQRMRHASTTAIHHKFSPMHDVPLSEADFPEPSVRSATISEAKQAKQEVSTGRAPMCFRCLMFNLSGPCELLFLLLLHPGPEL